MGVLEGFDRLFLDASFLVALYGSRDAMHARAVRLLTEASLADCRLCTIWDCIGESLTVLRRHFGHRAASALADDVQTLTIVPCDVSHRLEALDRLRRLSRGRSAPSYVDVLCSVIVRRELGGDPVLSFDRDLRRLGPTVIA